MTSCLRSVSTWILVAVGLVDRVQIRAESDLGCTHLRNNPADGSVCSAVCVKDRLAWLNSEAKEFPCVFSCKKANNDVIMYGAVCGRFCALTLASYIVAVVRLRGATIKMDRIQSLNSNSVFELVASRPRSDG